MASKVEFVATVSLMVWSAGINQTGPCVTDLKCRHLSFIYVLPHEGKDWRPVSTLWFDQVHSQTEYSILDSESSPHSLYGQVSFSWTGVSYRHEGHPMKILNLCHTFFPWEPKLFHTNYLIDLQSPCVIFRNIISVSSWHPTYRNAINTTFLCLWCRTEDYVGKMCTVALASERSPEWRDEKFGLMDDTGYVSWAHPPLAPADMGDHILCLLPSVFPLTKWQLTGPRMDLTPGDSPSVSWPDAHVYAWHDMMFWTHACLSWESTPLIRCKGIERSGNTERTPITLMVQLKNKESWTFGCEKSLAPSWI